MNISPGKYSTCAEKAFFPRGWQRPERRSESFDCRRRETGMNEKIYEFESLIYSAGDTGGAYVLFPYDIRKEFGRGRVKVHATFDGEPYDGSIVNMGVKNDDGSICYIIGILKSIREQLGKSEGDVVEVTVCERL